ncbi:alcohol dehydrogenase catalytic domain-containing protein [Fulvivirgaceae bacterium BMA12]|uniref:Alcohol dehydrogenase catalytic domain-containing protein n=1 Tax=Agaribacillus aureus TaxID=3051825 RepID=A0ABT8LGA3_9BACT|nr:alcohol dehydrogenase catalytic domain-containing protein [Fulvivirgaceae bacterium BMA12]
MRQAVMTKPGKIEFGEVPEPGQVNKHEIKLKIRKIGVCGSDIHVYHGKHPFTSYPVIQGHEYSGEVVEVGELVKKVKPGDKATARPQQVCGKCPPCLRGDYNICNNLKVEGFQAPGTAQDYFILPEDRIIRLPDALSYEQGAMIEPAAVGAHATSRSGDLKGKNVMVFGAGPIGNLVAQFAQARGAGKVLITDISDFRLNKAKECGIRYTANIANEDVGKAAKKVFANEGFDVVFECAGVEITLDLAIQHVNKGGKVVVVAVYGDRPEVDMAVVGDRELSLIGTLMYKHEDYEESVALIQSGLIKTEPLFTGHFRFEKYLDAYKYIDEQGDRSLKVIIDL